MVILNKLYLTALLSWFLDVDEEEDDDAKASFHFEYAKSGRSTVRSSCTR